MAIDKLRVLKLNNYHSNTSGNNLGAKNTFLG